MQIKDVVRVVIKGLRLVKAWWGVILSYMKI